MEELTKIIAQTILVRDLQKKQNTVFDLNAEKKYAFDLFKYMQERKLDLMLTEYIQDYDGLMIIENITEKPLNHTHNEKPY